MPCGSMGCPVEAVCFPPVKLTPFANALGTRETTGIGATRRNKAREKSANCVQFCSPFPCEFRVREVALQLLHIGRMVLDPTIFLE